MAKRSAGLLMCRRVNTNLEFFLVHPGGPYYANKNEGVWSIPKGETEGDEPLEEAARREFFEETGIMPSPPFLPLDHVRLKSGKEIYAWAFLGEWNPEQGILCNTFEMEWPPQSGKHITVPEADRAAWMKYEEALKHIHPHQATFLDRAKSVLDQLNV